MFNENAIPGAFMAHGTALLKNCGGGIAPAAIGGLIEGAPCSVNAFQPLWSPEAGAEDADKLLMRLNFPRCAVNG
jgi:hypothetical protein